MHMFKVLIVDDEELICELILRSIDWGGLGMTVIGVAYDGQSALNIVEKEKPQLIITDVRMPGMDGITLIQRVKDLQLESRFLVISGYQDFEFVRNAFKFGAIDYVLKPIDETDFTKTLLAIKNNYFKSKKDLHKADLFKMQIENSNIILQKQFFNDYVINKAITNNTLEDINLKYNLNFKEGAFVVLCIIYYDNFTDDNINHLFSAFKRLFNGICHKILFLDHEKSNNLIVLLNYSNEIVFKRLINLLEQMYSNFQSQNPFLFENTKIAIGKSVNDINFVNDSYVQANLINQYIILKNIPRINDYSNTETQTEKQNSTEEKISLEQKNQLKYMLELSDHTAIKDWMRKLFQDLVNKSVEPAQIYSLASSIVDVFYTLMAQNKQGFIKVFSMAKIKIPLMADFEKCKSIDELTILLGNFISDCFELCDSRSQRDGKIIETAKEYIEENYSNPICLEDVANIVYLNPTYFSVFFKNKTGINFSDYLINYRIEIALKLLKDVSLSISEISEKVGYKNTRYFSRLFKKVVGISPSVYRKYHV